MYESCKVLIIKYIFIKSDSSTRTSIDARLEWEVGQPEYEMERVWKVHPLLFFVRAEDFRMRKAIKRAFFCLLRIEWRIW